MFIVCKQRADGTLTAGTPPKVHTEKGTATTEAERLASDAADASKYLVFQAVSVSRRVSAPVETVEITYQTEKMK
jgi:hypothetical protein